MKNSHSALTIILTVFVFLAMLPAQELKNVQILPFESKKEITKYMKKKVAKSLGVKCTFCHNMKDYSDDSNSHKKVAREMIRMLMGINKHMVSIAEVAQKADVKGWEEIPVVECWACHRGNTKPEYARSGSGD